MMMSDEQIDEEREWSHRYAKALTYRYRDVLPLEDVVGLADLGLVEAWRLYDGTRGIPFTGYASQCVRQIVWDEVQKEMNRKACEVLVDEPPEREAPVPIPRRPDLQHALAGLNRAEKRFVRDHFLRNRSLAEIAHKKGYHRSWAFRLLNQVLKKLRTSLAMPQASRRKRRKRRS